MVVDAYRVGTVHVGSTIERHSRVSVTAFLYWGIHRSGVVSVTGSVENDWSSVQFGYFRIRKRA